MGDPIREAKIKVDEQLVKMFKEELTQIMKDLQSVKKIDSQPLHNRMQELRKHIKDIMVPGPGRDFREYQLDKIEAQRQAVESNKRLAASLKQNTATRFPNIASLLTGGGAAGTIRGNLGRMQKGIERPFNAAFQYTQEKEKFEKMQKAGIGNEGGFVDERAEGNAASALAGTKDKIPKGFGGEKMTKFAGKMGKFMDHPIVKAAGAVGMLGGSIITSIIKKGIEASPMMQAMLKIMNTAMMLFLRPVGDFIGGMLRPIALFFMREVALPFLRYGKGFMNMGDQLGKQLLAFFLKPVESISQAIMMAIGSVEIPQWIRDTIDFFNPVGTIIPEDLSDMFPALKKWENFDPMKAFASEKKMESIAFELLRILEQDELPGGNRDKLMNIIEDSTLAEQGQMFGDQEALTLFKKIWTEMDDFSYKTVSGLMDTAISGRITKPTGPGDVGPEDDIDTIQTKLIFFAQTLADAMGGAAVDFESVGQALLFIKQILKAGGEGFVPEMEHFWKAWEGWLDTGVLSVDEFEMALNWWIDENYDAISQYIKELEDAQKEIAKGGKEAESIFLQFQYALIQIEGAATEAGKIQGKFEDMIAEDGPVPATYTAVEGIRDWFLKMLAMLEGTSVDPQQEKYNEAFPFDDRNEYPPPRLDPDKGGGPVPDKDWTGIRGPGGNNPPGGGPVNTGGTPSNPTSKPTGPRGPGGTTGTGGGTKTTTTKTTKKTTKKPPKKKPKRRAMGGWITEPIFGIGEDSGSPYTFGEAGPELITPKDEVGGGGITANIVINIERVSSDVDLEQIKPLIEKALLEVHARRGII